MIVRRFRFASFIAIGAATVILGATACSSAQPASTAGSAPVAAAPGAKPAAANLPANPQTSAAAAPSTADAAKSTGSGGGGVSQNVTAPLETQAQAAQPVDRMVIRTAQLTVEVGDMEQALSQVRSIAAQGGGFVATSNTRTEKVNDQDRNIADLTIQVRTDAVDSTMSALRALGKVTAETTGSQDVTEEYVDLDSNLRNLQASEMAIQRLMDRAERIEDILSLQRELTNVRGQIERIQGRKRFLERRTDMATVTLSLRLPPVEASRPTLGGAWDPMAVAQRGWQASLTVLRAFAEVLIVVVAFSWWLVPLLAIGAYIWMQRRRPRPQPTTAEV